PSYDETDTARAARLLHEFVIDQAAHIIRTTEMDGGKDRMVVVLNDKLVRAPLKGQIVENAQRLVVRARSFLLWAQERRYGRRSVEKGMTDLFGPQTRVALGRGTVLSTPADSAWVVDLQSEAGASLRELVKTCG
ncbi:MAG: hypothetical protein N3D71_14680, partial [Burkholderiaceae bacterium]|nr:hypothetical protein [Burkholderiaceae bacterium]